ncbi:C6 finger domain protein, putative [Talaromyces stipitatus ATCC 10500]|uniref:C6 finger domain protein, putative n=1 Tax=Talaromyces stipitatus (strain ATCC 10500 / CBS 375.48 / QM 6759 / NRRL 1006) TaxID=441959 RepID=B8M6Z7_TALSN|nr:C6 finger domain protein, putative [Talaromyces stipitatus ATCC 10500]EED20217.1 C6 finger domain protein, putative [Talaromyces stipitatus ATCC 10500]
MTMEGKRYATSRRKACQHCSSAKAKCDLRDGGCSRVWARVVLLPTIWMGAVEQSGGSVAQGSIANVNGSPTNTSLTASSEGHTPNASLLNIRRHVETPEFTELDLVCPINVEDISNRWINSYVPLPGQKRKDYPASVTAFMYRILNSYVAVAVHGRGPPPFVHSSQVLPTSTKLPLSTCLSLVRICEKPRPGSEIVAADMLRREMNNIYEQRSEYDDMTLLAAFQAYMIYCMALFFTLNQTSDPFLRQAVMNLQELACATCRQGLVCTAEQQHTRPKWEAWIVAESKRRTLYAMYLLDGLLSTQDGLPTFLGTELYGLPAPSAGVLWKASTRQEWERGYNIHLADWVEASLYIHELWPIPPDMDDDGVVERRSRVDQWLENVDEYGTMMYAVTNCTHGG